MPKKTLFTKKELESIPESEILNYRKYKILPVDKLVKADWNYKQENEELGEKLKNNLKRNGQIETIIVRLLDTGYYEVVNGNHRLDQIIELGRTHVVCYDLGKVSVSEAQRIAIETNETKFGADNEKLAEIIKELQNEFEDIDNTLPYSADQLEAMVSEIDIDNFFEDSKSTESEEEVFKIVLEYSEVEYRKVLDAFENLNGSKEQIIFDLLKINNKQDEK